MLTDFITDCYCAMYEENDDFQEMVKELSYLPVSVGFMPAIVHDLYPVYALGCTSAKDIVSPNVYIIPSGVAGEFGANEFVRLVTSYYDDDDYHDQFQIEAKEMILLENPEISGIFRIEDEISFNAILCKLMMPDSSPVFLIIVASIPDKCWKEIIEEYQIRCDVVIDSHKGMGDWFESVPLYSLMKNTQHKELLPKYYFKGLYVSNAAPEGFEHVYTIPEEIKLSERMVDDFQKEIYKTNW